MNNFRYACREDGAVSSSKGLSCFPIWVDDSIRLVTLPGEHPAVTGARFNLWVVAASGELGPVGVLPDDDSVLQPLSRLTQVEWSRLKPQVVRSWEKNDGVWVINRLVMERDKREDKSEKARRNAVASWAERTGPDGTRTRILLSGNANAVAGECERSHKRTANAVAQKCDGTAPFPSLPSPILRSVSSGDEASPTETPQPAEPAAGLGAADCRPEAQERAAEIQSVYRHYLLRFGETEKTYRLTPKRRAKIAARLNEFEAGALFAAIDACASDDWTDRGRFRDLAKYIFRSEEQTEQWIKRGRVNAAT